MNEILITKPSRDYELIDSGEGEKLERYGKFILSRPDPQALWPKSLSETEWKEASARFFGGGGKKPSWQFKTDLPKSWTIELGGLQFIIKPTPFKHTGLFPEQEQNWKWIGEEIIKAGAEDNARPPLSILNLFGYTGGATLAAAKAGAAVTHVDGSKSAIGWARENADASGLSEAPIRWILDDARKFLEREIKRGKNYDGIIMDPPAFGHGPNKELWKIEEHFPELMELAFKVLSPKPVLFLINGYASGYSAIAYENILQPLIKKYDGNISKGELAIQESKAGRLLPCGIFARWSI